MTRNAIRFTTAAARLPRAAVVVVTILLLARPLYAAVTPDATVSSDQGSPSATVVTPPFSTTAGNELLLAFISSDGSSDGAAGTQTTVTSVAGGGLTWVLVQRTNAQPGTAEVWRAFSYSTLSAVTITATLSQQVASSLTVATFAGVDTSGTAGAGAIGAVASASANQGAPSASITTTRAGSLAFGVGNDWNNAIARTPGTGQSLVHQYLAPVNDTYWVQRLNAATSSVGTTVTIDDTAPTSDCYNLAVVEILPSTGGGGGTATYSLSGAVSPASAGAGSVLTLGGTASATTTADSSGNYLFAGLVNGTYSVAPSKSGYTFTPANQTVTIAGANVASVNFTAQANSSALTASAGPAVWGYVGQSLTFIGSAAGGTSPYSYYWTFGDGGSATTAVASHTYQSAGTYTPTLRVADSAGQTAQSSTTATISNTGTDPVRPQPTTLNTSSSQYQHLVAVFPLWITSSSASTVDMVQELSGAPSGIVVQTDPVMGNIFSSTGHSHFTVPYSQTLDFGYQYAHPFSVSAWVKTSAQSWSLQTDDNPPNMYVMTFDANSLQAAWPGYAVGAAATLAQNGPIATEFDVDGHQAQQTMFGNSVINDGKWHLLVFTYTPSASTSAPTSTGQIYVDGVLDSTSNSMAEVQSPLGAPGMQNPFAMYIGADDDGVSNPWQGMFCDLRFYDVALTAQQIGAMYSPATRWDLYK